jgi:crotonobetainyl-CoA:carnitine CoA-transferase CaiB-like acyl-CoA transferase
VERQVNGDTNDAAMLRDLRVVEIATWVAAPTVGAILAEYGADVTHIETPGREDPHRTSVSQAWKQTVPDAKFNSSYELNNRNKRSLAVSLKTPEGRDVFRKLIAKSDIFITNLLSDRQQRLGVDYETLRAVNERLIHVSITGWGTKGPFKLNRGFDFTVFWAASSMMHLLRVPKNAPALVRPGMGDRTTGLAATAALGLALYHRERTGKGQAIEVNLMHTGMWTVASDMQRAVVFGTPGPSYSRDVAPSPLTNAYETGDGRWLIVNANERAWTGFCACVGEPELATDPRFENVDKRGENNAALIETLDAVFKRHTLAEWTQKLNAADMTWAPGLEPLEAANHPQAVENGFFIDAQHAAIGAYKLLTFPFRMSAAKPRFRNQAPEQGANTREILAGLGYSPEQIDAFGKAGVVAYPEAKAAPATSDR